MSQKRKNMLSLFWMAVVFSAFVFTLFAPAPAISFELRDMAIVANDGIEIEGYFDLNAGNVCTRNGDIVLGGRGNVRMNLVDSIISTASNTAAITLENFAKISTAATNNVIVSGTSGVVPPQTLIPPEACPADPPAPTFDVSFDAADDVVCTQAGTTITPGVYRDLTVEFRGKCNFQGPGDYNFRSLNADTNSTYEFNFLDGFCRAEEGFNINVKEFAYFGEYGYFNKDNAPSVFLYVDGMDGDWPERTFRHTRFISPFTLTYPAFGYKGDGEFNACYVHVPNGTVGLKGKSDKPFNAVWIGKYFWEWNTLRVQTQPPGYFEDCCEKKYFCVSIFDFFEKEVCPGETLTIFGEGFNSSTVDGVYFFGVGSAIANLDDPAASAACSQTTINFVDAETMEIAIPAACASGDYYLGLIGDTLGINLYNVLSITNPCP